MKFGTTFSHRHAHMIGLNVVDAYEELLAYRFDCIRLCTYWDEDLSVVKVLLEKSEIHRQKVIVVVGMKSPRWPDFYIPQQFSNRNITKLESEVLLYVKYVIHELQHYSCITHWQIENEPLDPSGLKNKVIPYSILKKEIAMARCHDTRPLVCTLWGNELSGRGFFSSLENSADVVGIDLYYRVPNSNNSYRGPKDSDEYISKILSSSVKPVWITELQAEPWEYGVSFTQKRNPKSMNVYRLIEQVNHTKKLGTKIIFLWGSEYWLWRKRFLNDNSWCESVKQILGSLK